MKNTLSCGQATYKSQYPVSGSTDKMTLKRISKKWLKSCKAENSVMGFVITVMNTRIYI
jgi:hypothetical protein